MSRVHTADVKSSEAFAYFCIAGQPGLQGELNVKIEIPYVGSSYVKYQKEVHRLKDQTPNYRFAF